MKNTIHELVGTFPTVLQNTHLNINLQGWPAAVAVIAVSISGVSVYAIHSLRSEGADAPSEHPSSF